MRPIPPKMRQGLSEDPRMKVCAVSNLQSLYGACSVKIDYDHVWVYAAKQINEPWAILGVCRTHHDMKNGNREIRETIQRTSLRLATEIDLAKYPRRDWKQVKKSLGLPC